jgi:16S rRNA (guanine527-N7)-methyltransferase
LHAEFRAALLASGAVAVEHVDALATYGELVLTSSHNLTGAKSVAAFVAHIRDSLELAPMVRESLVDIGSGGGLPAIPLAIVTGVPVTMVESIKKKAEFLAMVIEKLGLQGEALAQRAEISGHDPKLRGQFGTGTARAVATAPAVAELLLPLIKPGGKALLQRGTIDDREFNALADASIMLGAEVVGSRPETSKSVIVVEKKSQTQRRFPRSVGTPVKKPLCY